MVVTSHGVEQRGWELGLEEARLGRLPLSRKSRILYPLTSLWQSRIGLRLADHVFCLSCEDRDYLSCRMGVPPDASPVSTRLRIPSTGQSPENAYTTPRTESSSSAPGSSGKGLATLWRHSKF